MMTSSRLIVFSVLLAMFAITMAIDDPVVIPPVVTASGDVKLLILFQAPLVEATDYLSVAKMIQSATTSVRLWVGISSFAGNIPDPIEADSQISKIKTAVQKIYPQLSDNDIFMSGHSLGGIIAKGAYKKDFSGLILFGAYLPKNGSESLPLFSDSVLHLAAEIDGLTRMTRIAFSLKQLVADVIPRIGLQEAAKTKPVVILPGVDNSQFAGNGVFIEGDIKPEISDYSAHVMIGEAVSSFIYAQLFENQTAVQYLVSSIKSAQVLVEPFWKATAIERFSWCVSTQETLVNMLNNTQYLRTTQSTVNSVVAFSTSNVDVTEDSDGGVSIITSNYNEFPINPLDISTLIESALSVDCLTKRQIALMKELKKPTSFGTELTCMDMNKKAVEVAQKLLLPQQLQRYVQRGRSLEFLDDKVEGSSASWLAAELSFDQGANSNVFTVQSPAVFTSMTFPIAGDAGQHNCKLLSPARAVEWMLVDSLKDSFLEKY